MKIKVTETIKNYEGKELLEKINDKEIPMTWKSIIFTALQNFTKEEQNSLSPDTKIKCHIITERVYSSDEPDLTVQERAFIIERINKIIISPLICGRAKEFFEEKKEDKNGTSTENR